MKKVLLVNPYDISDKEYGPPRMGLGLAYIVSVLRKEKAADIRLLDKFAEYRLNGFNSEKTELMLDDLFNSFKPDIVGFTTYTETISDVIKDARRVKEKLPNALVIIGGAHATAAPVETMEHYGFIDVAVIGEGEYAMLEIAKGQPLDQIKGIVYRDGKDIRKTGNRPLKFDIDNIPFPAWDLLHMDYYSQSSKKVQSRGKDNYVTMLTSRGCKGACSFCIQVKVHRRFCTHSPEYVVSQIEEVLTKYPGINAIEFIDNLFLCNIEATEKLCRALIKEGISKCIKWKAQTRADSLDKDMLKLMKESGCFMLGFGFESGSQRILDVMNKRVSIEQCYNAAKLTKDAGLELDAYFIYGYPNETKEEFMRTLEAAKNMCPNFVGYGRFSPVPGSLDYDRLIESNLIKYRYDDLSLDWEKTNVYKENVKANYTNMSDTEFNILEQKALYDVIKPINVRQHMSNLGLKDILSPSYILKLLKKSFIVFKDPKYFICRVSDFINILLKGKNR